MNRLGDDIFYLSKTLKAIIENNIKDFGIGIGQLHILIELKKNFDNPMTQKDLAILLNVDKGNVSRSISKLIDKNYISLCDSDNNKTKTIKMTLAGENALNEVIPLFAKINHSMVKNIDKNDLSICNSTIKQMILNLEEKI